MNLAIEVDGLEKSFEEIEAVRGVSFEVERAEVFGFLGPNGAGKTTTINMLCTLAGADPVGQRLAADARRRLHELHGLVDPRRRVGVSAVRNRIMMQVMSGGGRR